jgi:hypothetical protein
VLAQDKFSYNDSPNRSTCMSPFHIFYGMHPSGVYDIRELGKMEKRSEYGEYFAARINELQEQVKEILQQSNVIYKTRAYLRRRENNYEVGDLVLSYPRKERFSKREYKKLKMTKIGPCRILRKFSANAYELEMPTRIGISPIFYVAYLYPYVADETGQIVEGEGPTEYLQWLK